MLFNVGIVCYKYQHYISIGTKKNSKSRFNHIKSSVFSHYKGTYPLTSITFVFPRTDM